MYVAFLIYCSFFVLLQLVSYPYFITDFIYLQWGYFFSLSLGLYKFDIDISDKDYENYKVLKILI